MMVAVSDIAAMLTQRLEALCAELLPRGRREGAEMAALYIHQKRRPHLRIEMEAAAALARRRRCGCGDCPRCFGQFTQPRRT